MTPLVMAATLALATGPAAPLKQTIVERVHTWNDLAGCESDHDWSEGPGGLGPFRGGLQYHPATWAWLAPSGFPSDPAAASPREEMVVAELVLEQQGWGAWPVCSRKIGVR